MRAVMFSKGDSRFRASELSGPSFTKYTLPLLFSDANAIRAKASQRPLYALIIGNTTDRTSCPLAYSFGGPCCSAAARTKLVQYTTHGCNVWQWGRCRRAGHIDGDGGWF